jgi:hypothetical protein
MGQVQASLRSWKVATGTAARGQLTGAPLSGRLKFRGQAQDFRRRPVGPSGSGIMIMRPAGLGSASHGAAPKVSKSTPPGRERRTSHVTVTVPVPAAILSALTRTRRLRLPAAGGRYRDGQPTRHPGPGGCGPVRIVQQGGRRSQAKQTLQI